MARKLLLRANEFVGLDQKFWAILETGGFGDSATGGLIPTSSNSVGTTTGKITYKIPRDNSPYRSGRSEIVRISKKKDVAVSMEMHIIPGAPDMSNHPTAPDADPFLQTVFGALDTSDPTLRIYKLAQTNTASFRVLEEGTHFSRQAVGCVMDSVSFTLPGDGKAMMKFSGFAQDVYTAGEATLNGIVTSSNTLVLATGMGGRFEVGAYVDVIDHTDGVTSKCATARLITAIVTDTLTVNGSAFSAASGDIVIGYAPVFAPQDDSNALLGLKGSFSTSNFGSVDCQLIQATIEIKNNYTQKNQFYGTSKICGYIADKKRAVSIKMDVLLTKANYEFYSNNKVFIADGLTIVLQPQDIPAPMNSATGRTFTFSLPKVEFNVPDLEQPADGFVKLSLEGIALATDVNTTDTELTLQIS